MSVRGLSKNYGAERALTNFSFDLPAGELLALLGPSGCGKSTLLRLVAGLLEPDAGDVRLDGASVAKLPPERRGLGMVFQRPNLFPHLNVERNVAFGLGVRGRPRREVGERVAQALQTVQLSGFGRRFPSGLSGGQAQRVALARALVTEPRLLLLDEPFSSLDAALRGEMRELLRAVQRRTGVTTVFVTHDQAEALELADRLGVMFGGALEQLGTPEEVFERPRTLQVARFLGSVNVLSGTLLRRGAEAWLELPAGRFRLAGGQDLPAGRRVEVAVRPERIGVALYTGGASAGPGELIGEVVAASYRGVSTLYTVSTGVGPLEVGDSSGLRLPVGCAVRLTLPAEGLWALVPDDPRPSEVNA